MAIALYRPWGQSMLKRKRSIIAGFARRILFRLLGKLRAGELTLVCPDQSYVFGTAESGLQGIIEVHDERLFPRVLLGGDVGFGEAYVDGDWTSPNLIETLRLIVRNQSLFDERHRAFSVASRTLGRLHHLLCANTPAGSRRNIGRHYDLGNDFYRLFLDPSMAYSCARYETAADTLEEAQRQKYEHICRKLSLGPADHLLEIGTGWGGLAIYAATHFGCHVTTTTISRQQFKYAQETVARHGLRGQVWLLLEDYRNLAGRYNKIVSVEMFEAVGYRNYDTFFRQCDQLLDPHGSMLLQTITIPDRRFPGYRRRRDWVQKHVFPGAELASVSEILRSLTRSTRFELYHLEEIGTHYSRTLKEWRRRFLAALPEVQDLGFDECFLRLWDYYFASCEAAFAERSIGDVQMLLTKGGNPRALWGEPWEESQSVHALDVPVAGRPLCG